MRLSRLCPQRIYRRRGGRVKAAICRIAAHAASKTANPARVLGLLGTTKACFVAEWALRAKFAGLKLSGGHPGLRQFITKRRKFEDIALRDIAVIARESKSIVGVIYMNADRQS